MDEYYELLDIIRDLSKRLVILGQEYFFSDKGHESLGKGMGGDDTTVFDAVMEQEIIDTFESIGNFTVLSEECGTKVFGNGKRRAFVDPLDGSKNAIWGIPLFAYSIAISTSGGKILGDVDFAYIMNILTKEEFYAIKGQGAYYNGRSIQLPRFRLNVQRPIRVLGVELSPYPDKAIGYIKNLLPQTSSLRALGTIALDLCYLAKGALDAIVDIRGGLCRTLDIAAGYLIVKEAGGILGSPDIGNIDYIDIGYDTRIDVVAAVSHDIYERCMNALKGS